MKQQVFWITTTIQNRAYFLSLNLNSPRTRKAVLPTHYHNLKKKTQHPKQQTQRNRKKTNTPPLPPSPNPNPISTGEVNHNAKYICSNLLVFNVFFCSWGIENLLNLNQQLLHSNIIALLSGLSYRTTVIFRLYVDKDHSRIIITSARGIETTLAQKYTRLHKGARSQVWATKARQAVHWLCSQTPPCSSKRANETRRENRR